MSAPGSTNHLGVADYKDSFDFKIPTVPSGGSNRDMGSLALMLVANWFINGKSIRKVLRGRFVLIEYIQAKLFSSMVEPCSNIHRLTRI